MMINSIITKLFKKNPFIVICLVNPNLTTWPIISAKVADPNLTTWLPNLYSRNSIT